MRNQPVDIDLTCEQCGKQFIRNRAYQDCMAALRNLSHVYCSRSCSNKSKRNTDYGGIVERYESGETMKQIGDSLGVTYNAVRRQLLLLGVKPRSRWHHFRGDKNPTLGKSHTEATKTKIREANKRQFSDPAARERHAILTCRQIAEGRTGKAYNQLETKVAGQFQSEGVIFQQQYRVGRFVYDFYIPETRTLVEVHGRFWHADTRFYDHGNLKPVQQRNVENDKRKAENAIRQGYELRVIWEDDVS